MAKSRADYIAQGRAAYAAGTVRSNHHTSWQGKAEYDGYVQARDEAHAVELYNKIQAGECPGVAMRTTNACTLVNPAERRRDEQINSMLDGYTEAMLWSSTGTDPETEEELEDLVAYVMSEEAERKALDVCTRFYDANRTDLGAYADLKQHAAEYGPYECIGHDLWLTTAGHGVGFWDRGMGRVGKRLSDQCGYHKAFPPLDAYIGDDGLVYLS